MAFPDPGAAFHAVKRVRVWYALLVFIIAIFGIRLFYLQIIRYNHYKAAALSDQLKQYQIPAQRGLIEVQDDSGNFVPIVLNQQLYTLYADPTFIKDANKVAGQVADIIGGPASDYIGDLTAKNTRYAILAKQLTPAQSSKLLALHDPGLGTQAQDYRTYPQGSLASQLLGFVDASGTGQYGVEQAMNKQLAGTPGQVKAITDLSGVPLPASGNNVETPPVNGNNVDLTINLGMQSQMEKILADEYKKTKSQGLSAIIMDPNTGQVEAMANYPTYNPADYQSVSNPKLFLNGAVTDAIEPGSSMKTLTTSAALNMGVIQPDSTFYDPAHWIVDGFNITDIEQDGGPREQSVASTLALSLNTGATWMLMQMGGGQIDRQGRDAWYSYMTKHFRLGEPTGIEQGYESAGYVPLPENNGAGINLTYANTSFGQGVTVTPMQMAAALSSVINGGTYYQPTLVAQTVAPSGKTTVNKPKVLERNVVSPKTGRELIPLMENVVTTYHNEGFDYMSFPSNYLVGGKTGTAQIANPAGGYYDNIFNGTYLGFVGGDTPQYVIAVFNIKPGVPGYAGSYGGQPVFADLAHMLIDNGYVTPKS